MGDNDLQVVIEFKSGPATAQSVTVTVGEPCLVGRLDECDITITEDPAISRQHCRIEVLPTSVRLTNISANGTRVNGQDVENCDLKDGDEIQMGDATVLAVHVHAENPLHDQSQAADESVAVATTELPESLDNDDRPDSRQPDQVPLAPSPDASPQQAPDSLQVIHGPAAGMVIPLMAGQPLVIGSQAGSDLEIEGDPSISREHCRIEMVPPDCHLHDLSSHGTLVNHRRVEDVAGLSDGDEIEIGQNTVIRIALKSAGSTSGSAEPASPVGQATCQTGLIRTSSGPDNPTGLWAMAQRLSGLSPLHAIVDFARSDTELPEDITDPNFLLECFSAETIAAHSPVLLSPDDRGQMQPALEAVIGNDAAMLIFSQSSTVDLHQHLRSLATLNPSTGRQSRTGSLFAFWWPSLLNQMLENSKPEMAEQIIDGIDAVLIEADDEGAWSIFATEEFSQQAERLGLVTIQEVPPPEEAAV